MKERDPKLQRVFLDLLKEVDPEILRTPEFAQEFAGRLADFADAWATDAPDLDRRERSIARWARAAYRPPRMRLPTYNLETKDADRAATFEMQTVGRAKVGILRNSKGIVLAKVHGREAEELDTIMKGAKSQGLIRGRTRFKLKGLTVDLREVMGIPMSQFVKKEPSKLQKKASEGDEYLLLPHSKSKQRKALRPRTKAKGSG